MAMIAMTTRSSIKVNARTPNARLRGARVRPLRLILYAQTIWSAFNSVGLNLIYSFSFTCPVRRLVFASRVDGCARPQVFPPSYRLHVWLHLYSEISSKIGSRLCSFRLWGHDLGDAVVHVLTQHWLLPLTTGKKEKPYRPPNSFIENRSFLPI